MRRPFLVAVILVVAAVAAWWVLGRRSKLEPSGSPATAEQGTRRPQGTTSLPAPPGAAPAPATPAADQQPASAPPAPAATTSMTPRRPPLAESPEKIEADAIALNIRHFGQRFGGNPVGTNAEIVKAMTGDNEGRATYLPPDLQRLNGQGELIDRWGRPYFFHQLTSQQMEVRSAGPDGKLWTPDDVVGR